jgi:type II secretory pathway pseudopilin PulG
MHSPSPRASFTLIELLIVIGIVAVLAVVTIIVLNPAELLKQSRDSNRLADLNVLNKALSVVEAEARAASFGSTSTVYVSVPDSSMTCANLVLPSLPAGYSYGCAPTSTLRSTNGTGWIPVNFDQISSGSPISALPVDPVNSTSTGEYYTYIPAGSWELTAMLTSGKYKLGGAKDSVSKDGGQYPELLEVGTSLKKTPVTRDQSLIGYWTFDEGNGSTAYDHSGKGNNGTLIGSPSWQNESSCKALRCLNFPSSYVQIANTSSLQITGDITISFWMKPTNISSGRQGPLDKSVSGEFSFTVEPNGELSYFQYCSDLSCGGGGSYWNLNSIWPASSFQNNNWSLVTLTRKWGENKIRGYTNGQLTWERDWNFPVSASASPVRIGIGNGGSFIGFIDDVRIYNRDLSASEIAAIYNATN